MHVSGFEEGGCGVGGDEIRWNGMEKGIRYLLLCGGA